MMDRLDSQEVKVRNAESREAAEVASVDSTDEVLDAYRKNRFVISHIRAGWWSLVKQRIMTEEERMLRNDSKEIKL